MNLYVPGQSNLYLLKQGFLVNTDNLKFLIDYVQTGKIVHLPPELVKPVAEGISMNPNFMYAVGSGVPISHNYCGQFQQNQTLLAVEVVRFEPNPVQSRNEPSYNMNRYIFGKAVSNDKAYGIDVTTVQANPITAQVGNHWDEIREFVTAYFPTPYDSRQ